MRDDNLDTSLRGKAIRSGFIQLGAQAAQVILTIGSGVVLARLLTPEDFGLMAMVSSLAAFIGHMKDFGLPFATVHQETVDHQQLSVLFWVNLKLNLLLILFMALMAPALAWFYGEQRLTVMTLMMAGGFFCLGLTNQHRSLLMRQMRFGSLMGIEVGSLLTGIVVGVGAALLGARYWALVFQFLADSLTRSVTTWLVCDWRPAWPVRRVERLHPDLRSLLSYGAHLTGSRLLSHIGRHLDRVLVGYFGGVTAVGLYDNAYRWSLYPVQQVYLPLLGVAVASLSRVRHDPKAYCASLKEGLLPVFSVVMPALTFMIIEAREVILVLLGSQWLEAAPLFRLLCVAALATSVSSVTKWLYLSQGDTKRLLQWGFIDTPVMVVAVVVGVQWGALGVATSYAVATCMLVGPSIAFCLKTSPLSMRDFLGIVWRPVLASALVAVLLLTAGGVIPKWHSMAVELLMKLTVFALAYLLLWVALPGGRQAVADARHLLAELWPKTYSALHTDVARSTRG
jgi:O-antigen/teichoic acid export membrane protein